MSHWTIDDIPWDQFDPSKIDSAMVERYVEQRKDADAANGAINRELGLLTRLFKMALENKRVAQVPTMSGYEQGLRRIPPEGVAAIEEMFADDERAQLRAPLTLEEFARILNGRCGHQLKASGA